MWFNPFVEQEFHNGQLKKTKKKLYMQSRCMFHTCKNKYIHSIVYLHCSLHIHRVTKIKGVFSSNVLRVSLCQLTTAPGSILIV